MTRKSVKSLATLNEQNVALLTNINIHTTNGITRLINKTNGTLDDNKMNYLLNSGEHFRLPHKI